MKILITVQVINRDFYNLYRENRRKTAKEIDQYKLFIKAVNGLLLTMRDIIEESEGGLYIQGIGYFCHEKSKRKQKSRGAATFFKRQKKKYKYKLSFFPDKQLKDWHITYNSLLYKSDIRDKYYIHFNLIESYYKAKRFADNLKDAGAIVTYAT